MGENYCFDYIRETVEGWIAEGRKVGLQQMLLIPWNVELPCFVDGWYVAAVDCYGNKIADIGDYAKERRKFIENLFNEIKENNDDKEGNS